MKIKSLTALEILDSRGVPTVRAILTLDNGSLHTASVPSGASTGTHEACELRDGDKNRYHGKGVLKAVENIEKIIAPQLVGQSVLNPQEIDKKLIELDGTDNKSRLGANAILAISLAVVKAGAVCQSKKLWEWIHDVYFKETSPAFPRLMVNIINGGKHASWNFDIQEFMIVPTATNPSESVRVAAEIFYALGSLLKKNHLSTLVGDEGGYSPALASNDMVFENILEAAKNCGYEKIKDFIFAVDCASSEWYKDGKYVLPAKKKTFTAEELTAYYSEIGQKYNIQSFEDPFAEDDWKAFVNFTDMAHRFHFQVVGDDLFVTNPTRIKTGIEKQAANAVLVKLNQIGTVLETARAVQLTKQAGWKTIISHRSGETEDSFIADFAYACGAEFIKTGSMSRSERLAKYNRFLEIEKGL